MNDATRLLGAIEAGEPGAAEQLLPLVYDELRKLAASRMAREVPGNTLQPTALVHEAWLRLVGDQSPHFANRAHFFSAAAEAMRRILIDRARQKAAVRHGGEQQRVDIHDVEIAAAVADDQLLQVNDALDRLAAVRPVQAELVKLRYFVGMSNDEAAAVLNISPRTAKYYWSHARAWLYHAITTPEAL